jgi:hypothetical protein
MPANNTQIGVWRRFVLELKHERKKAAVLSVLTVVAIICVVRLLSQNKPAAAQASTIAVPAKTVAAAHTLTPIASAEKNSPALREYLSQAGRKITRDIFAANLELFPPDPEMAVGEAPVEKPQPAVNVEQVIRAQAQSLTLQSTMASSTPTAIINGKVLGVGDWISGFQIVEITARSCKVMQNNVVVVLEMKD